MCRESGSMHRGNVFLCKVSVSSLEKRVLCIKVMVLCVERYRANKRKKFLHRDTGSMCRDTGSMYKDTGSMYRDTGSMYRDTGSMHRDTGSMCRDTG
jgi:hypothetical protein